MNKFIKNGMMYSGDPIFVQNGTSVSAITNPTEQQLLENGWSVYVQPELTDSEKLQQAKDRMIANITAYDASSNVNSFTVNGEKMWLNYNIRQRLRSSIDAYKANGIDTVTKWFNNKQYTFPVDTWLSMLNQVEVYASDAKNVTDSHIADVNALTTITDVEAFDYTSGYPTKLQF